MLGWQILITNQHDVVLASWTASLGGLEWVESMVDRGYAEMISEGGYPTSYKLKAKHVLPFLRLGQRPSSADLSDLQVNGANFNNVEIATCDEEDVLVFEAWDQS